MNYSESTRKKRREELNRRFRRRFFTVLFLGLLTGFLIGRLTACGENQTAAVEPDTITSALPAETDYITPVADSPEPSPVLLGTYRVTAYCSCEICCGEWAKNRPNGIVYGAAGVELIEGVSCASPLPFGTVIEVEGLGEYTVQDRIASWVIEKYGENQIDIYFSDHDSAKAFGVQYLNVYEMEDAANDQM
jgi:hypothetical protein